MATTQIFTLQDPGITGQGQAQGPQQWSFTGGAQYLDGTILFPGFPNATNGITATMTLHFDGVSISIIGNSQPIALSPIFTVAIDNNTPYNTSTGVTSPQLYTQWYTSPTIEAASHTMVVTHWDGMAIDYAVVIPGPQTSLTGQTLMIDDAYESIVYKGSWTKVTGYNGGSGALSGNPFGNGTTRTSTAGDSFTFTYTGANLTVWGLFLNEQAGSFSLSYSIDNSSTFSQTYSSDGTNTISEQTNFKLLDTGPLTTGNHTLVVTLTDCISQTLAIDYILYAPGFDTLATMPNLTATSTTSTTSSATTAGATGPATSAPSSSKSNVGAIAGGVVGGLAFLVIMAALAFFWQKRRRDRELDEAHRRPPPSLPMRQPSTIRPTEDLSYVVEPYSSSLSPSDPYPSSGKRSAGFTSAGFVSNYRPSSPTSSQVFDSQAMSATGSVSGGTGSTTGSTSGVPHRQAEIRRRLEELQALVDAADSPNSPGVHHENVDELRRRIQMLTDENQHLTSLLSAPPAY